jgi:CheY-like chemotaxis protein
MRARLSRVLDEGGVKVNAMEAATDALQACSDWRPDAIVSASDLRGMTGVDLAYAMSEHATLSDVPLVLNGDDGDLARLEAYRAGIRDYIPRPFLDEELLIRVQRIAAPAARASQGLRGSLLDIGLPTLLSLFEFERKSGVLLLLDKGEIARVFVAEGRCIKVETTAQNGMTRPKDRLMRLLDWREGHFEFSPTAIGGRDELGITITQILLEHARHSDESKPIPRP